MTRIVCLDVETTGLGDDDEIIEVATVDVCHETGALGETWSTRIKPRHKKVPPVVSGITHIIDDDLVDCPDASIITEKLSTATHLCAHNAKFDRAHIDPFCEKKLPWICTLRLAKRTWPDAESHKLQSLRYQEGLIEFDGYTRDYLSIAHAALPDTLVAAKFVSIFLGMANRDLDRLIKGTEDPIMLKLMPFGKHKGFAINCLDEGYLEWASKQKFDDDDLNFTIQRELQRRGQKVAGPGGYVT